jgi:hypothetical protein
MQTHHPRSTDKTYLTAENAEDAEDKSNDKSAPFAVENEICQSTSLSPLKYS